MKYPTIGPHDFSVYYYLDPSYGGAIRDIGDDTTTEIQADLC